MLCARMDVFQWITTDTEFISEDEGKMTHVDE